MAETSQVLNSVFPPEQCEEPGVFARRQFLLIGPHDYDVYDSDPTANHESSSQKAGKIAAACLAGAIVVGSLRKALF